MPTRIMHQKLVGRDHSYIPPKVRLPVRVKLVFNAPVPAYIFDKASPFSAQSSRWEVQMFIVCRHSGLS